MADELNTVEQPKKNRGNPKNLRSLGDLPPEVRREYQSRGGKKACENRHKYERLVGVLRTALTMATNKAEIKRVLEDNGLPYTNEYALMLKIVLDQVEKPSADMVNAMLNILGEKQTDSMKVSVVDASRMSEYDMKQLSEADLLQLAESEKDADE